MRTNTNEPYDTFPGFITTFARKNAQAGACYQDGKASKLEGETEISVSLGQSKTLRRPEPLCPLHIVQGEIWSSQCHHKGICAVEFV